MTARRRHRIETLLGKLEGQASPVFREMIEELERGAVELQLMRDKRNTVRRFLLLLKYRGSQFH